MRDALEDGHIKDLCKRKIVVTGAIFFCCRCFKCAGPMHVRTLQLLFWFGLYVFFVAVYT